MDETNAVQLSVIVPVFNEQENIRPLATEIRACLQASLPFELIYVDDGSRDNTYAELQALSDEGFPELQIVRHDGCFGQSASVLSGCRQARAEWIVTLDGDGQNDPADILALYHAVVDKHAADRRYVCAAGYRKNRHDGWVKRWSSRIANAVRSRLLHDNTPDTGCGLKVMRREAFLALPFFDHLHRFIPALIQRNGGKIIVVEVNHRARTAGQSKYGVGNRLWVGLVDLMGVKWLCARARNPRYLSATARAVYDD